MDRADYIRTQAGAGTGIGGGAFHRSRAPLGAATRFAVLGRHVRQERELSEEDVLQERHQSIMAAANSRMPARLPLPTKPILPSASSLGGMMGKVGGWFETAFSSALTSQSTAQTIGQLNAAPSEELLLATQKLENLHKTLIKRKPNRMHLIGALSQSIDALQKLLEADDSYFTFRFPTEPENPGILADALIEQLHQKIRSEIELLSHYLGYLEGFREIDSSKVRMSISREDLTTLRFSVMGSLFHPEEARKYNFKIRLNEPPQGLLATLLYFRDAQQGLLNRLVHDTLTTAVEIGRSLVTDTLGLSKPSSQDIDTPKFERVINADGQTNIVVNYAEDGGTLGGVIEGCLDLFKRGNIRGIIRSSCIGLLASLKQIEIFLTEDGKDLLSETDATDSLDTHPVIASLRRAIALLEEAKQPGKSISDLKSAVSQTKEILSKHSIWFGSVINLGLPGPKAIEPVSSSLTTLQEFEKRNPYLQKKENHSYAKDAETLATEVAEIGSYQAAFQGIFNYFIKERGSWIKKQDRPVFSNIMKRVMTQYPRQSQLTERREMMIREFRSYISKATDVFFLKRWTLQIFTPQILWLSEYCVVNIKDGAFRSLKAFINDAKSDSAGDVSIEPIERLKAAIDHLYLARQSYAKGSSLNIDAAVKTHCSTDRDFLESEETGCKTLGETYTKIGDSAVDRFLGLFEPTAKINRATEEISSWASTSIFLRFSVLPITGFLTFVNYLFIFPVEYVVNKITHPFVKMILKSTDAVGTAHKLLGDSMFPKDTKGRHSTKVMNQIIVNLLHKLSQLLQEPSDPSEDEKKFAISKATQTALSGTIKSILKLLAIQTVQGPDDLKRFDQIRESSGLSPLLAHMIRLIIGEDEQDLDTKVADAAKELLARCYYLLMDEEILNQQIVLALTSIKEGMLSTEANEGEEIEDSELEIDYDHVIQELKTIVIQQAAHLAHTPISKGEIRDKALREHITKLKHMFLGSQDHPDSGLISKWRQAIDEDDRTSAISKAFFKEAKQASQELLNDILKLKAEVKSGQAGSESLEIHLRNLSDLQKALSLFTTSFLDVYNLTVLQTLPRKDEIAQDMQVILTRIKNLQNSQSTEELESNLESIKELLATFTLKFPDGRCSEEIKSFIESCEKIAYRRDLILERVKVTNFSTAVQKIIALESQIATAAITDRNTSRLAALFKSQDSYFSGIQEIAEIKKLEKSILETIANAENSETARSESLGYFSQLKTLLTTTQSRLRDSYNEKFSNIDENVGEIEQKITPILMEFRTSQGAGEGDSLTAVTPSSPPIERRKTLALCEDEFKAKLKSLEEAVRNLETVSSINIPLDKIPFFRTTEAAIVSLLQDRLSSIEEVLFKNRNALMAVVIKQELAFLNPKTPETTSL
jgi:hypothetical protein